MQITLFEIVHGFQAQLPSSLMTEEMHFSNENAQTYAMWLRNALKFFYIRLYMKIYENQKKR